MPREGLPTPPNVGRYILIARGGLGDTAEVLRAYDPSLQREVTLKLIAARAERREEVLREARAMAKLSHPNVVAIYDVEITEDAIVLAMESVRGTTLQEWLGDGHPPRDIVARFIDAGHGLAAAHDLGVLHRNFKASNVLLGNDGRVRVTEFGLASNHPLASTELGPDRPRRTAPEQNAAEPPEPAADQYAFCLALSAALSQSSVPGRRRGTVAKATRRALARGLAVRPEERWPSMHALLHALAAEPRQQQRRWATLAVTVGLSGGTLLLAHARQSSQRCGGAEAQLAGIWDAERSALVQGTFAAIAAGQDAWLAVEPQLDDYARRWKAAHVEACEATTIRAEQSAEVMDLKMACLQQVKADLRAVVELLRRADAQVVERASQVFATLPELDRCSDDEVLLAEIPPPRVSEREAVEAIRAGLAEVRALRAAGKHPDALERARPLEDQSRAVDYPPLRTEVLMQLGHAYNRSGSYAGGETALREALRSALANAQWHDAGSAAMHLANNLGMEQRRPKEALAFAQTARALIAPTSRPELRTVIGNVLQVLGRYHEAEAEYRAAMALHEEMKVELSASIPRANLAATLRAQGRLEEAEALQRAELALRRKTLPEEHSELARARFDLARTLHERGRYAEAETLQRSVLANWQQTLGPDHLNVATARAGLGNMLAAQGREKEAESEYEAALTVQRRVLGPRHFMVSLSSSNLGAVLTALGRYADAERHLRESLAIDVSTYGPDHPDVAITRSLLALPLSQQGRFEEAEAQARTALIVLQKTVTPGDSAHLVQGHPRMAAAHVALAAALRGQGRHAEAEVELRAALHLAEANLGAEHPSIIKIRYGLGHALVARGRHREGEAELRRAVELADSRHGPQHPSVAETRGGLAEALLAQGRYREAQTEYRRALAVLVATRGPEHPDAAALQRGLNASLRGRESPG